MPKRTRKRNQHGGVTGNNLIISLANAAHGHDENEVLAILDDPSTDPSYDNNYIIRYACQYGLLETVKKLLQDPRVDPTVNKNRPIRDAAINGHTEVVRVLLQDTRVDLSSLDEDLLITTIRYGRTEVVKLLLQDPRVDPSVSDQSALSTAASKGYTEIVKLLLQDPRVDPSVSNQNTLMMAVQSHGLAEIVKLLLQDPRVDPSVSNQKALRTAVREGKKEVVEVLLNDPRVDPSINNQENVEVAVVYNNADILTLLLKHPRVDPAVNNQEYIKYAASHDFHSEVLEVLLQDPRVDPTINLQYPLRTAVEKGFVTTVRELLKDPRVDPGMTFGTSKQAILLSAIVSGDYNMIKLLLLHPKVDPSVNNQFAIRRAVNSSINSVMALLQDPRVDPTVGVPPDLPSAIEIACTNQAEKIVKVLLDDPRVTRNPTIFRWAKEGKFSPHINALILSKEPDTQWEGFSRGDMEKLDSIFSEDANNFSCCPVCLRYVQREDGCMYMSHNCHNEPGANTVDEYWYNMYKNNEGIIFWCTICGRICLGHRHYKLGATSAKLELVPVRPGSDPFAKDCANEGGGGKNEKMVRFTAFRELAYELQKEVGKISRKKALEELTQEMWSAPISKLSFRRAKQNLEAKAFRLPSNVFPAPVVSENAPNVARNAQNTDLLPTLGSGYNMVGMTDENVVIQFHHRQKNGEVNHHEDTKIAPDSFEHYIQTNLNNGEAGACWLKDCTAIIHPDEIKALVDMKVFPDALYKRYKDAFNRLQKGGGGDILQEATKAECVIWNTKKNTNKNTSRRNSVRGGARRSRRLHGKVRFSSKITHKI